MRKLSLLNDHQFTQAIKKLGQLVAIPTVSNIHSPDYNLQYLDDAAHLIEKDLEELAFDVRPQRINHSPFFLLGSRIANPGKPTILLYAHYDVQPVNRELWDSDPFQMIEKNGRLYGRGVSDDKAGIVIILSALKALQEGGVDPSCNVKVLIEGEEEFGSNNMSVLLKKEQHHLLSDALIVFDGVNKSVDIGTLENATRGVLTMNLTVEALEKPIHSGMGCLAPDPVQTLAALIYSLRDPGTIKGFMDDCLYASPEEIALLKKNSESEEEHKRKFGVIKEGKLRGDSKLSIYQRLLEEPSISILNINSGYPGGGNSIQAKAGCTIGVRLTAGQDPDKIEQVLRNHFAAQPNTHHLSYTFKRVGLAASAWKTDSSRCYASMFLGAMKQCYPHTAVVPTGATIPFLADFQTVFPQTETFIIGIEDPESAPHSHNESQSMQVFRRAINSLITFLQHRTQEKKDLPKTHFL